MTIWFKFFVAIAFIASIYLIFHIRLRSINNRGLFLQKSNRDLEKEIKQRKKTEKLYKKEKEKAEKAAEVKDEFLSNMSHEIRTPLNMIMGYLQLISVDKDNLDQFLKVMHVSADNLLHLVNQILDLSKIEKGKLELNPATFDTCEYISELKQVFNDAFRTKGIQFNVEIDNNLPHTIIGDKHRINQILTNLLGNALKFTESGFVNLKIHLLDQENNQVLIKFTVEDSGIGIAQSKMETVFEKFTQEKSDITRKFGGTGLGLTIARELILLQQGQVEVKSIQGKGTTFDVILPFEIDKSTKKTTEPEVELPKSIKGLKILIVDDNQFNLTLSSTIVESYNAFAKTAISGTKALDLLAKEPFDVVLMDIHMPDMNGFQTTQEIVKRNYDIPIIGCTADIFDETFEKAIQSGMIDVITKPFEIKKPHRQN